MGGGEAWSGGCVYVNKHRAELIQQLWMPSDLKSGMIMTAFVCLFVLSCEPKLGSESDLTASAEGQFDAGWGRLRRG